MHYTENKSLKGIKQTTFKKVVQKELIKEESVMLRFEEPKVRYLKLQQFFVPRKYHKVSIFPELRLCGRWLEDAGFSISEYVSVTVMNELLIIRSAKAHETKLLSNG